MTQARQKKIMDSDPHPLIGWAKYLQHLRGVGGDASMQRRQPLAEAVKQAQSAYLYWRPELRYKLTVVKHSEVSEARKAALWFIEHRGRL